MANPVTGGLQVIKRAKDQKAKKSSKPVAKPAKKKAKKAY